MKRFYGAKQKQRFGDKVEDYNDEGLRIVKFDLMTGVQETKIVIRLVEF